MSMIKDEELAELSDDPEWAFVEYEHLVRQRTAVALAVSPTQDHDRPRINYMRHVLAAVGSFKLGILGGWSVPQVGEGSISSKYEQFQSEVDYAVLQIRPRHARRVKRYSVALDPKAKALVRHHLQQIKDLVDRLDITERKRNRLYSRIAALEIEISRDRTPYDVVMALIVESSSDAGKVADNLEPVTKRLREIVNIFGGAKEEEDSSTLGLPGPEEHKQIAPPKEAGGSSAPDDEMPF